MKLPTLVLNVLIVIIFSFMVYRIELAHRRIDALQTWVHDICFSMQADGYTDPCSKVLDDMNKQHIQ